MPHWHLKDRQGVYTIAVFKKMALNEAISLRKLGWEPAFDWSNYCNKRSLSQAYKLIVPGNRMIEGAVSYHLDEGFAFISLLESALSNRYGNPNRIYVNVADVLIGEVCRQSIESGFEGYVSLVSKSEKISYYVDRIGAHQMGGTTRMYIDSIAANRLIELYYY
ncbi:hypothetical protein [Paenibacillus sp. WLX2291]|uniref:hypothetical protein n=1 Tax=Paenibacillus sp. WLX2291 TaxID=3296934 RepID=UPI003983E21C